MLLFPKPFEVPASCYVWSYPRALAVYVWNHAPGSYQGWGQRSISRMKLMLKYLKFILIILRLVSPN